MGRHGTRIGATLLLVGSVGLGIVGACKANKTDSAARETAGGTPSAEGFGLAQYAKECTNKLGPLPAVDCSQIDEVVIWKRGADGKPVRVTDTTKPGETVAFTNGITCANPSLAGPRTHRCMPFARIGRIDTPSTNETVWVADCRRADVLLPLETSEYESVGIIGFKPSTGEACFFDTKRATTGKTIPAKVLPPPSDPGAESVWMTPSEMGANEATQCVRCHSGYPWLRTPPVMHREVARYLGVAQLAGRADYFTTSHGVPSNVDPEKTGAALKAPYVVVSRDALEAVVAKPGLWTPREIDTPGKDLCHTCHRVGGGYFTARKVTQSVGLCHLLGTGKFVDRFGSHCAGIEPNDENGDFGNFDWHKILYAQANWKGPREGQKAFQNEIEQMYEHCYTNYQSEAKPCVEALFNGAGPELSKD